MEGLRLLSSDCHYRKIRREGYPLFRFQKEKEAPSRPILVKPPTIYPGGVFISFPQESQNTAASKRMSFYILVLLKNKWSNKARFNNKDNRR